jgi:hypothetical protein
MREEARIERAANHPRVQVDTRYFGAIGSVKEWLPKISVWDDGGVKRLWTVTRVEFPATERYRAGTVRFREVTVPLKQVQRRNEAMKCDQQDCAEMAMSSMLKDPFGKSDAVSHLCSKHAPSWSLSSSRNSDAYDEAIAALKELSAMYAHAWDRVDGCLVMMPGSIERFEKAHAEAKRVLRSQQPADEAEADADG